MIMPVHIVTQGRDSVFSGAIRLLAGQRGSHGSIPPKGKNFPLPLNVQPDSTQPPI